MSKKLALFIFLLALIFMAFLLVVIKIKREFKPSLTSIKKEDIISSSTANLKYFYELKPNKIIKIEIKGEESVQTINADGLNERFNYTVEKPQKTFRIITLGDSFTNGSYVDTKDNYSEVLEDMLNSNLKCSNIDKFEVINLGVAGYDTQYEIERFKKRGGKYNPDLVIWYFIDLLRYNEKIEGPFSQALGPLLKDKTLSKASIATKKVELILEKRLDVINQIGEKAILDFQSAQIKQFRNNYSGKVLAVPAPILQNKYRDFLKKAAIENKFVYEDSMRNYYDMDGSFLNAEVNPNVHPNQKGHRIIAEDFFNYLKGSNLISCQK